MRIAKDDVTIKMQIPGAVLRQQIDFGDATGLGKISGEYFSLSAGVDTTQLFEGLEKNMCQCPHWGFVLRGQLTTTNVSGIRWCAEFCVNGLLAGDCRLVWSHNEQEEARRT